MWRIHILHMGEKPFILIPETHNGTFYPNDLARHFRGRKVLFLMEQYLDKFCEGHLQNLFNYLSEYKKSLEAGKIDLSAKEKIWPRLADRPITNSFLHTYFCQCSEIYPKKLATKQARVIRDWIGEKEFKDAMVWSLRGFNPWAVSLESVMRQIIISEQCVDYAEHFGLARADMRPDRDDPSQVDWDVEVDISRVTAHVNKLKRLKRIYDEYEKRMHIGIGVKAIIEHSPDVDVFVGLWGRNHIPELWSSAKAAGCDVEIKQYSDAPFSRQQLCKTFYSKKLWSALFEVAKGAKINKMTHNGHPASLEDLVMWLN